MEQGGDLEGSESSPWESCGAEQRGAGMDSCQIRILGMKHDVQG